MARVTSKVPKLKQVIVLRKDLNMSIGKACAQSAHASCAAVFQDTKDLNAWIHQGSKKVVLECKDEEELLSLVKQAQEAGLNFSLITDAGKTEFNNISTNTCIAIGPNKVEDIDKITKNLNLYKINA